MKEYEIKIFCVFSFLFVANLRRRNGVRVFENQ